MMNPPRMISVDSADFERIAWLFFEHGWKQASRRHRILVREGEAVIVPIRVFDAFRKFGGRP